VVTTTVDPTYAGLTIGIYNTARQSGVTMGAANLGLQVNDAMPELIGLRTSVLLIVGYMTGVVVLTLRYINA